MKSIFKDEGRELTARGAAAACACMLCWLAVGLMFELVPAGGECAVWALAAERSAAQAAAVLCCARMCGYDMAACGLCRPQKGALWPALACCAVAALCGLLLKTESAALPQDGSALALAFLQLCAAAPLAEEIAFRGAAQGALGNGWRAVAAQAVLFALAHGGARQMVYAFLMGLALGWLRKRTGSIWPCAALHCLNNAAVFAISLKLAAKG